METREGNNDCSMVFVDTMWGESETEGERELMNEWE